MKIRNKLFGALALFFVTLQIACAPAAYEVLEALEQESIWAEEILAEDGDFEAEGVKKAAEYKEETPEKEFENLDRVLTDEEEDSLEGSYEETEFLADLSKAIKVTEDGTYTEKEEVALYIHLYEHLPDNYITKKEARSLGWESSEGNLWDVAPGKSIGGDYFGNYEGLLPEEEGRDYFECDIDYEGGYRNGKRIIYSDDGLIFYTEDHYESFEQLYE